jgi:hypothetical protein
MKKDPDMLNIQLRTDIQAKYNFRTDTLGWVVGHAGPIQRYRRRQLQSLMNRDKDPQLDEVSNFQFFNVGAANEEKVAAKRRYSRPNW